MNKVAKPEYPKLTKEIVEGFATSCLTKYYDDASQFADFHREWWDLCCSDDKFVAICAPRGHSKSTTITITYTLASVLFRQRKYVLIVADTESQASLFLGQIKQILYDSSEIHSLFGLQMGLVGGRRSAHLKRRLIITMDRSTILVCLIRACSTN